MGPALPGEGARGGSGTTRGSDSRAAGPAHAASRYFREGQPRKLALRAGQAFRLQADAARQRDGTPDGIWVDYPLHAHLEVGQRVYVDDGQIQLDVVEKGADHLVCEVSPPALPAWGARRRRG